MNQAMEHSKHSVTVSMHQFQQQLGAKHDMVLYTVHACMHARGGQTMHVLYKYMVKGEYGSMYMNT